MCMKVRIHNFAAIRIRTMYLKSQNQTLSGKIRFFSQKIIVSYFASFRIQTLYHEIQFTFSYFCHNQDLNSELFVLFRSKFKLNLEAFSDLSTRRLFTEDRHANGFFFILSLRFRGPLRFFRGLKSSFASIRMEPICLRP